MSLLLQERFLRNDFSTYVFSGKFWDDDPQGLFQNSESQAAVGPDQPGV